MVAQNSHLATLEAHSIRGSSWLTLPGWPGTGDWVAQRLRVEPNKTIKKPNEIIPNDIYTHRLLPCPVESREASSSSRWEVMQRPICRESKLEVSFGFLLSEIWDLHERGGGMPVGVRGVLENTRKSLIEPIKQDSHGPTETETASTGYGWVYTRYSPYMF